MSRKTGLSEKHWQALKMFEQGSMTTKEIAESCGWKVSTLYSLCEGNTAAAGQTAMLFKAELSKIEKKRDGNIKKLVKSNTEKAHKLINRVFTEIEGKKKITAEDRKIMSMYTNALSKFQPATNITNLSYSYTKGLTAEELIHEFKRLKSTAESSFGRGRVQQITERG